jgi:hypothetical protein
MEEISMPRILTVAGVPQSKTKTVKAEACLDAAEAVLAANRRILDRLKEVGAGDDILLAVDLLQDFLDDELFEIQERLLREFEAGQCAPKAPSIPA